MKPFTQDEYGMSPDAKTLQPSEITMHNTTAQQNALRERINGALASLNTLRTGAL